MVDSSTDHSRRAYSFAGLGSTEGTSKLWFAVRAQTFRDGDYRSLDLQLKSRLLSLVGFIAIR